MTFILKPKASTYFLTPNKNNKLIQLLKFKDNLIKVLAMINCGIIGKFVFNWLENKHYKLTIQPKSSSP